LSTGTSAEVGCVSCTNPTRRRDEVESAEEFGGKLSANEFASEEAEF